MRGMPKKFDAPTSRKSITLPDDLWKAVAEYRFENRIASEAEAVRGLLSLALSLSDRLGQRPAIERRKSRGK
jgi:hypothetical protein